MISRLHEPFPTDTSRGGWAHRLEVAKRQRLDQTSIRKCGIAENLLKGWASGGISAVRLAEHMHTLRYTDNFTAPAVIRLSDIGGKTPCLVNSKKCFIGLLDLSRRLGFTLLVNPIPGLYRTCIKPFVFFACETTTRRSGETEGAGNPPVS